MAQTRPAGGRKKKDDGSLWYKDAVIYQLHVRAFHDSDENGIGDFRGLASRLDYLQDLGVTALWLLPFYPSPLRDDGYDIADYFGVHPDYGTPADFRHFLKEAHRRGLKVITELVVNHTSDQHPWFQRARRAPAGSKHRDFYVWSDNADRYRDARIIFKDFEDSNWTWDPVAKSHFWHRFYRHQPDLNFENPEVRKALHKVIDHWFSMGVDGLRLDAVPYLHEREGTSCENLEETHAELRALRAYVDAHHKSRMLLAEANQWPEDAVAYFGKGDECHMAFHFPLMPRLFMALRMEDRYPILDILSQTPPIPESAQWAVFLRNHDELTLEMVTDEERDYMYRVYAHDPRARINLGIRRRLAPLLGNDRRRIELMNGLLFSLVGTPVLYYGDEIGMGDNIYLGDRNGVRTPMQWSGDRNAGFSRANAQRLFLPIIIDPDFHYETINVEVQQNNPSSLLWWMKRLIALRKAHPAFGRGSVEFLHPGNRKVLAFLRRDEGGVILVIANLSRFAQYVELDLSEFEGRAPSELFGGTAFPRIGTLPYLLTLGPHAFLWFSLGQPADVTHAAKRGRALAGAAIAGGFEDLFRKPAVARLEEALLRHVPERRWFGGKARGTKRVTIVDSIPLPGASFPVRFVLAQVEYREGEPETYVLPLGFASGERARRLRERRPAQVVTRLRGPSGDGLVFDAASDREFCGALLEAIARRRGAKGAQGEIVSAPAPSLRRLAASGEPLPAASPIAAEQSNSSVRYGDQLVLKLIRRVHEGIHPEVEIPKRLTARKGARLVPPFAGSLEYRRRGGEPATLAVVQEFVRNEGDAWRYTLDFLGRFFERINAQDTAAVPSPPPPVEGSLVRLSESEIPSDAREHVGIYVESARLLGTRTAEMHVALAADRGDPDFAPEASTPFRERALYQSLRNRTSRAFGLLRQGMDAVPAGAREEAERVAGMERELLQRYRSVTDRKITAKRIRIHGDFHLGQVLFTGRDFVIIDFEGEPGLPLSERRRKRSPLRDVAGMLRSFDYAAQAALEAALSGGAAREEARVGLQAWAAWWARWAGASYLRAWREGAAAGGFLPKADDELEALLDTYLLDKAVYELAYELNNRPAWVGLPLRGILGLLGAKG
jgi:maltose alpha-D-glucosyltransferase / alpha-amylase